MSQIGKKLKSLVLTVHVPGGTLTLVAEEATLVRDLLIDGNYKDHNEGWIAKSLKAAFTPVCESTEDTDAQKAKEPQATILAALAGETVPEPAQEIQFRDPAVVFGEILATIDQDELDRR